MKSPVGFSSASCDCHKYSARRHQSFSGHINCRSCPEGKKSAMQNTRSNDNCTNCQHRYKEKWLCENLARIRSVCGLECTYCSRAASPRRKIQHICALPVWSACGLLAPSAQMVLLPMTQKACQACPGRQRTNSTESSSYNFSKNEGVSGRLMIEGMECLHNCCLNKSSLQRRKMSVTPCSYPILKIGQRSISHRAFSQRQSSSFLHGTCGWNSITTGKKTLREGLLEDPSACQSRYLVNKKNGKYNLCAQWYISVRGNSAFLMLCEKKTLNPRAGYNSSTGCKDGTVRLIQKTKRGPHV